MARREISKIVIVFDMCSSTSIVEDLARQMEIRILESFLRKIGAYLEREAVLTGIRAYKFMGDGWILLADSAISGPELLGFMRRLCEFYEGQYAKSIKPHLMTPPRISGLTLGVARGVLIRTKMFGQSEYIGRAINVACRLQSAVKDSKHSPAYRALITMPVFREYFRGARVRHRKVTRQLRNIKKGKDYNCVKLFLLSSTARPDLRST